jgi:hypothetical protein
MIIFLVGAALTCTGSPPAHSRSLKGTPKSTITWFCRFGTNGSRSTVLPLVLWCLCRTFLMVFGSTLNNRLLLSSIAIRQSAPTGPCGRPAPVWDRPSTIGQAQLLQLGHRRSHREHCFPTDRQNRSFPHPTTRRRRERHKRNSARGMPSVVRVNHDGLKKQENHVILKFTSLCIVVAVALLMPNRSSRRPPVGAKHSSRVRRVFVVVVVIYPKTF